MRTQTVLAVDQGTTNSKALLVGAPGTVVAKGTSSLSPIRTPQPGWFEQDPEDLWQSVLAAVAECLAAAGASDIVGLALTNQRESVVAWDRATGRPLSPVLGWQDGRAVAICHTLAAAGQDDIIRSRTGLPLDPMFSGPKIRWLLDALGDPGAGVCVGTIDAYLVARLTGECLTEAGNASRTLLFNLATLAWDDHLLDLFDVPQARMPVVRASNAGFGVTRPVGAIPGGLPVVAVLGDSHAALYGHGITRPGVGKVTYGTGSSVMIPATSPDTTSAAVTTTLAWLTDAPCYAREGNIIATGAALEAVATLLQLPDVGALLRLAATATGPALSYVPAFSGLGAPFWDREAVGLLVGLGRDTTAAQVARAGVDAVAQQVCDVIEAVSQAGEPLDAVYADGGASTNAGLMQLQADLAGVPVTVSGVAEVSAMGVARLAWRTLGADAADPLASPTTFEPRRGGAWREAERTRWKAAVARSRGVPVKGRP
ncbi:MAG: hypothetical protein LBI33_02890 [Propionibacteriaceae bacterium]|jgi:glycerol kinase|nr:hypothetical protein [Propionibacteriaceae bacterium]